MRKTAKNYDKEFKLNAVKLVKDHGLTQSQVASDLGISEKNISRWLKEFNDFQSQSFPGKGKLKEKDEQIRILKKSLLRAEMERDILKKAVTFFSQETNPKSFLS